MSSKFTPRRTLQKTPAVCESRQPPRQRSPSLPIRWNIPDTIYMVGTFADLDNLGRPPQQRTATLYRIGTGTDEWFGSFETWGRPATARFGMPNATGVMGILIDTSFPGNATWSWNNIPYDGPWPQFQTHFYPALPLLPGTPDETTIAVQA